MDRAVLEETVAFRSEAFLSSQTLSAAATLNCMTAKWKLAILMCLCTTTRVGELHAAPLQPGGDENSGCLHPSWSQRPTRP